jgi:hypothetical protein
MINYLKRKFTKQKRFGDWEKSSEIYLYANGLEPDAHVKCLNCSELVASYDIDTSLEAILFNGRIQYWCSFLCGNCGHLLDHIRVFHFFPVYKAGGDRWDKNFTEEEFEEIRRKAREG